MNMNEDNSSQIVEDIKYTLFDDRNFNLLQVFDTWVGNGNSFIVRDENGVAYRVTVEKEQQFKTRVSFGIKK